MSRVACVRVEAFAAAAVERCEPGLREQPLAVVTGAGPAVNALPAGDERAALASVPLRALEWPEGMAATFTRWGLQTLGDLAGLPREGLGARLGAAGLDAHDRAMGVDRAPWVMWTPP